MIIDTLFVLGLELVSIQIATGVWSARRGRLALGLFALFLMFQAFPIFATYYDAREQTRRQEERASETSATQARSDLQEEISALTALRQSKQSNADGAQNTIVQLTLALQNARDAADREAIQQQIRAIEGQVNAYLAEVQDLTTRIATLRQSLQAPDSASVATRETTIQYITSRLGSKESVISGFVALMFPVMIFGLGYVLAREGDSSQAAGRPIAVAPLLDLSRELEFCRRLPQEKQAVYAERLRSMITSQFEARKSSQRLAQEWLLLEVEEEDFRTVTRECASVQAQLQRSGITGDAEVVLTDHLTEMLRKSAAFSTS